MLQIDGPPAPETLRRDQLARRERIVRTAARALANGDYDQVKVSDVARDSGVALGTLYRYFASKEHLQTAFTGPFDADHDAIFSTVNSVLDGSLRAWVMNRATIQDVYRHVDDAIRLIYEYSPN